MPVVAKATSAPAYHRKRQAPHTHPHIQKHTHTHPHTQTHIHRHTALTHQQTHHKHTLNTHTHNPPHTHQHPHTHTHTHLYKNSKLTGSPPPCVPSLSGAPGSL